MQATVLCIGNSHMAAIRNASRNRLLEGKTDFTADYVEVGTERYKPWWSIEGGKRVGNPNILADIRTLALTQRHNATVLCMAGAAHFSVGYVDQAVPLYIGTAPGKAYAVPSSVAKRVLLALDSFFLQLIKEAALVCSPPIVHLSPPPPIFDVDYLLSLPGEQTELAKKNGIVDAMTRLRLWKIECELLQGACEEAGVTFLDCPTESLTDTGFLAPDAWGRIDPLHANAWFGERQIEQVRHFIKEQSLR